MPAPPPPGPPLFPAPRFSPGWPRAALFWNIQLVTMRIPEEPGMDAVLAAAPPTAPRVTLFENTQFWIKVTPRFHTAEPGFDENALTNLTPLRTLLVPGPNWK